MVKSWDKFDEVKMGIIVRHIKSSGLPDNLFDPGERQLKPVVKKRPKQVKPAEKTNVSPDLPAPKKLRPSYNLSSDLTTPSVQAMKPAENGTLSIPYTPDTAVVVTAAPTPVYSVDIKDPTSIKSQLPFKESVAVATATSVP
jgi:poly(A) polymerase